MYVELVERSITNRGNIIPLEEVKRQPFDFERYISMFPFTKDVLEYVKVNNTIRGYKGKHYCPMVIIDIDNEDLEIAKSDTINLLQHLVSEYKVNTSGLRIYFSGNKGFHIGIPINVEPTEDIAERCKLFVEKISNVECDMAIYEPHRIIRLPNSLNAKSNLYKIPLTWDELNKPIEWILERAKKPKEIKYTKIPNGLGVLFENIKLKKEVIRDVSSGLFAVPQKGDRNNLLFKSACRLYDCRLKQPEILNIISNLNKSSEDPLPEHELLTLISSAEQKTGLKQVEGFKSFGYYVPEWYELTKPESNVIYFGFPTFDKELRGKLRGKLCIVAHYGGTRKSLLAQNIAYFNIQNNQRVAYSSMEMGVKDLYDRFIDMIVTDTDRNPHYEIEQREKSSPGVALNFIENQVAPLYNNKLFISFSGSMNAPKYRTIINELQETPPDIFIVDGLNMMKGTTTEDIDEHTKGLKEIAKEFNIFVVLIAHVSRGLKKDTRDVSSQARGSEKIIDNCDFYVCPSLIRENNSEDEYVMNKGYLRLVNKRGTGNVRNIIYDLDCTRLLMTESDINVKEFDNELKF